MTEKNVFHVNGYLGLIVAILLVLGGGWLFLLRSVFSIT